MLFSLNQAQRGLEVASIASLLGALVIDLATRRFRLSMLPLQQQELSRGALALISGEDEIELLGLTFLVSPSGSLSGRIERIVHHTFNHRFLHREAVNHLQRPAAITAQLLTHRRAIGKLGQQIDGATQQANHITFIE